MTITIKIDTRNAAFLDDDEAVEDGVTPSGAARDEEVSRILRAWASRIPKDGYGARLYDYNGNRVGAVIVTGLEEE